MLEITDDTAGEPTIAVGRGAATLAKPCQWCARRPSLIHGTGALARSNQPGRGGEAGEAGPQLPDQHVTRRATERSRAAGPCCHKGRTPPANRRDAPATEADARNRPVLWKAHEFSENRCR